MTSTSGLYAIVEFDAPCVGRKRSTEITQQTLHRVIAGRQRVRKISHLFERVETHTEGLSDLRASYPRLSFRQYNVLAPDGSQRLLSRPRGTLVKTAPCRSK